MSDQTPKSIACALALSLFLPAAAAETIDFETVTFPAADGVRLAADYYPPNVAKDQRAPIVILLHMYRSDRKSWEPLIAPLHEAGFAILAIDLRGHGESATTASREAVLKRDPELFKKMQEDVRGAYNWLTEQPALDRARLALVGASVGASVALQYAAKDRSVDAVVGLSPGLNYMGLDSAGDIAQVTGREILLLATEDERDAPYTLQKRGAGVKVQIFKEAQAHGTKMFGTVPQIEIQIVRFLRNAVGKATDTHVFASIERNIYHRPDSAWLQEIAPTNLRVFSSPEEAEARGLRAAKSQAPGDRGPEPSRKKGR